MRENFKETLVNKSNNELEIISKDNFFFSAEERILAFSELEKRNASSEISLQTKKESENLSKKNDNNLIVHPKVSLKDLIPSKNYYVTPVLVFLNSLVFLAMVITGAHPFEPDIETLIHWGGNLRYITLNGQIWRLLTSLFIHFGFLHLLFNMYALVLAGAYLEKALGRKMLIFAYITSGLFASVSSLTMNKNVVSVGASGAIFGIFGVLLILLLFKEFNVSKSSKKVLLTSIVLFLSYNIVYGLYQSGIDNAAHIGGLIAGTFIGYTYFLVSKEKIKLWIANLLILIILSIPSVYSITHVDNAMGKYYKTIQKFSLNEQKALKIYNEDFVNPMKENISFLKNKINTEGIQLWEENKQMLLDLTPHKYPESISNQIIQLIEYAELRKQSCNILLKQIDNNSEENNTELFNKYRQIEEILKKLEQLNMNKNSNHKSGTI